MLETDDAARDLAGFVLPETGVLIETADPLRPCVLLDAEGAIVAPVETFFAELQANSRPATTIRSYGMDLLRWWRFLSGWGVAWDRASRRDARDFARWMQITPKVSRVHWRRQASGEGPSEPVTRPAAGVPNPVTGRAAPGRLYSASTRAHCETVLRSFYDFHLEEGTGPIINPFPSARERRRLPAAAGQTSREPAAGRYRPSLPQRGGGGVAAGAAPRAPRSRLPGARRVVNRQRALMAV